MTKAERLVGIGLIAAGFPSIAMAATIKINTNGYNRMYSVSAHQNLSGDQTLHLSPGIYSFSNGVGSFAFTIDSSGKVTSLNPHAARTSGSILTLNLVNVRIIPGNFDRAYYLPGQINHASGDQTVQSIAHVEDAVTLMGTPFATFMAESDGRIRLMSGKDSVTAFSPRSISFLNAILTIDPDEYAGMYVPIGGSAMLGTNQIVLIPRALDRIKGQDGTHLADFMMNASGEIVLVSHLAQVSSSTGQLDLDNGTASGSLFPQGVASSRTSTPRPTPVTTLLPIAFAVLIYLARKLIRVKNS